MTDGSIKTIGRYEIEREIGRGGMAVAGRPAKPSGTTTTGEIRTELRSGPGTDSSIRFGRTDLQKVRAGVAGAEPAGGERSASKAPDAAASGASAIPPERKKRWGYAIFAALAIFAAAIGIRMAATQRAQTAAAETAQAQAQNPYADVQVGDMIEFGSYEQDNNSSNGPEPIGWRVLEVSGGSALIVSEYALDARAYNEDYESVMWATCTLRKWLNGEFYDTAFNEEEKGLIALTKVKNADHPTYGTEGGKDTEDRVFLLSLGEAERYFEDDEDRRAFPTEYAIAQDVYVNDDLGTVWWWLRSPGLGSIRAAGVLADGSLDIHGGGVYFNLCAVRPALRLKMTP